MAKDRIMNQYEFANYCGYTYYDLFDNLLIDQDGIYDIAGGYINPKEIIFEEQKDGHKSIAENWEKQNERSIKRLGAEQWVKESIIFHVGLYSGQFIEPLGLELKKIKGKYRFICVNDKLFLKYLMKFRTKLSGTELKNIEIALNDNANHCAKKLSLAISNFGNKKNIIMDNKPQLDCKGASLNDSKYLSDEGNGVV
jgi:hypothetical protein